jgi:hypothetical protein
MNKKLIPAIIALALCAAAAGAQTWTVYGDSNMDFEHTVISKEQFERLKRAHETSDASVEIGYGDNAEFGGGGGGKVIKGTRPNLQGYFYVLGKLVNLSQKGREEASVTTCMLMYGHSERGAVGIVFYNVDFSWYEDRFISLRSNRYEYERRYNQFKALVEGR